MSLAGCEGRVNWVSQSNQKCKLSVWLLASVEADFHKPRCNNWNCLLPSCCSTLWLPAWASWYSISQSTSKSSMQHSFCLRHFQTGCLLDPQGRAVTSKMITGDFDRSRMGRTRLVISSNPWNRGRILSTNDGLYLYYRVRRKSLDIKKGVKTFLDSTGCLEVCNNLDIYALPAQRGAHFSIFLT